MVPVFDVPFPSVVCGRPSTGDVEIAAGEYVLFVPFLCRHLVRWSPLRLNMYQ